MVDNWGRVAYIYVRVYIYIFIHIRKNHTEEMFCQEFI